MTLCLYLVRNSEEYLVFFGRHDIILMVIVLYYVRLSTNSCMYIFFITVSIVFFKENGIYIIFKYGTVVDFLFVYRLHETGKMNAEAQIGVEFCFPRRGPHPKNENLNGKIYTILVLTRNCWYQISMLIFSKKYFD